MSHYVVIRNEANEIISTRQVSPVITHADASARADSREYPTVELWGGDESGPRGAYALSVWMNGRRIYS